MARRPARPPRGQHFLHDQRTLARITEALDIRPGGAGARVLAVEIDPKLAAGLRERFGEGGQLEVMETDILEAGIAGRLGGEDLPVQVTGNLPYYITSPILRRIFGLGGAVSRAVLMMQHEVAQRVAAAPGSADYGYLSVLCRLYSEPRCLFAVPPGAFRPPPKVRSAVVSLEMHRGAAPDPRFLSFLKLCFSHPRKKLINNLAGIYPRELLASEKAADSRPGKMSLAEFERLWRRLSPETRAAAPPDR